MEHHTQEPTASPDFDRVAELRNQLVSILREATEGESQSYEEVVKELQLLLEKSRGGESAIACKKLTVLMRALASCTSEIVVQRHWSLCSEILNVQFVDHCKEIRDVLIEWFGNAMMTTCALIPGCLSSLAVSLVPFLPRVPFQDLQTKWSSPDPLPDIHTAIFDLIEKVHCLIPHVAESFLKMLRSKQPFVMRSLESHCLYVTAVFDLMKRPIGRHLQEKLWTLALHHLLDVDVHIHVEDLDRSASLGREVKNDTIFTFELDDEDMTQLRTRTDVVDPEAKKLSRLITVMDALMELVFDEMERQIAEGRLDEIWRIMMSLLDRLLISTHAAQFTHFLVFYLAERNPEAFVDGLVTRCVAVVQDGFAGPIVRSSYALYIASFLSRAKFATTETRWKCLGALLATCETYAQKHTQQRELKQLARSQSSGSSTTMQLAAKHELFSVCVQSVVYMLCYLIPMHLHHPSKEETANELRELIQTRLSPLLYHWLDPLNRISSPVAVQFAELVEHYGIIQCNHLINSDELNQEKGKLQAYFPFDPYCLPRSSTFLNLESSYLAWNELAVHTQRDTMETDEAEDVVDEKMVESLSLEDNSTLASSVPLYNSLASSLRSDGL